MDKPEIYSSEVEEYLTGLCNSGCVSMMVASIHLHETFTMTRDEARECLLYWMSSHA